MTPAKTKMTKGSGAKAGSVLKKQRALRDARKGVKGGASDAAEGQGGKQRQKPVKVLRSGKLGEIPWLVHGFSTRQGGVSEAYGGGQLNLAATAEDSAENVERNRERLLRRLKAQDEQGQSWPMIVLNQAHTAAIHRVYKTVGGKAAPEWARLGRNQSIETGGDGLITDARGVLLAVKVADCLPVIVADRKRRAVGIFHAGWRGTAQRIVEKGIGEMRRQLGSRPQDLLAVLGPGIGACCYEIGDEVESEFESQFAYSKELFEDVFDSWSLNTRYPLLFLNQRAPGHGEPALSRHLDLVKANWCQLLDAGVPEENIESMELCTACRTELFFSYRKDHVTGRMMAVVGMR